MYKTSDDYKSKIYEANTKHLLKVYINDEKVEDKYVLGCSPTHELFSNNEFALGSVTSKAIELKLHKSVVPDTIEKIYIESGITSEPVPIRILQRR